VVARDGAQIIVDQYDEPVERAFVTTAPLLHEPRYFASVSRTVRDGHSSTGARVACNADRPDPLSPSPGGGSHGFVFLVT
jgi:hypothetical protein